VKSRQTKRRGAARDGATCHVPPSLLTPARVPVVACLASLQNGDFEPDSSILLSLTWWHKQPFPESSVYKEIGGDCNTDHGSRIWLNGLIQTICRNQILRNFISWKDGTLKLLWMTLKTQFSASRTIYEQKPKLTRQSRLTQLPRP
jgi:hypothetical protein